MTRLFQFEIGGDKNRDTLNAFLNYDGLAKCCGTL